MENKLKKENNIQQPLKAPTKVGEIKSYEGENALKRSAITNGEMESSPALIKGSPTDLKKEINVKEILEKVNLNLHKRTLIDLDEDVIEIIKQSFNQGYEQAISSQKQEEIEFISYILTGNGYTKEYYIKMLKDRLSKLKQIQNNSQDEINRKVITTPLEHPDKI